MDDKQEKPHPENLEIIITNDDEYKQEFYKQVGVDSIGE